MRTEFAPFDVLPNTGTLVLMATVDGKLGKTADQLDRRTGGAIKRSIELAGDKFKRGSVDLVCPSAVEWDRLVVFAVDDPAECSLHDLEVLGGRMAVKLNALGVDSAHAVVDALDGLGVSELDTAFSLATGVRLRNYRFDKYRKASEEDSESRPGGMQAMTFHLADSGMATERWALHAAIAAGVEHGRDLVTEPANVLTPAAFADACKDMGNEVGLEVEVLDRKALEELGMRALLGVAQGSDQDPFVVVMNWKGGAENEPPVALVGKGVCFDTGGISLKPSGGMEEMKWDMGGAGAVFGAMKAIAGRKAGANVVGVLGLVENMPGGNAQRPGDVVAAMSGTTIEVINTDAEGRLVLADALHYTKERFQPKVMIDVATLTGAVIIALGHEQAGLFTTDDALSEQLSASGEAVGERVWRLPMDGNYAKHIKSEIADIKNTGRAREAGATAGAVFLQHFVGDVPWAHLDIAGVAWSKRDLSLAGKGATGFGRPPLGSLRRRPLRRLKDKGWSLAEIGFYHLTKTALEPALGQLLAKILESGKRGVVMASSVERVEALTKGLWTWRPDSFLPHGSSRDGHAEEQPIYLTDKPEVPNGASVLVLVDNAEADPPPDGIERVLIMFDGKNQASLAHAREQWKAYQEKGEKLIYWQQTERGGWNKAREA